MVVVVTWWRYNMVWYIKNRDNAIPASHCTSFDEIESWLLSQQGYGGLLPLWGRVGFLGQGAHFIGCGL